MGPILIAGGAGDPNLAALLEHARSLGIPAIDMRIPTGTSPAFEWLLPETRAMLDEIPLEASGAFLRYDVFASLEDARPEVVQRAGGWYATVQAWTEAASIRVLNREAIPASHLKPAVLAMAHAAGLLTPETVVTNSASRLAALGDLGGWIAKPVAGGDFCRSLAALDLVHGRGTANAPMPAIVQRRLESPELRLYIIGTTSVAFELRSPSLDYRELQDAEIAQVDVPWPEEHGLRRLMEALRMDFSAADFKRDPESGRWVFLELNTSQMFALFDEICGGEIGRAIVQQLAAS